MGLKGVLIVCELIEEELAPVTLQLLGMGRKLADELQQDLGAILLGENLTNVSQTVIANGADQVYILEDSGFRDYSPFTFSQALRAAVDTIQPEILIFGQTTLGGDIAAWLAGNLKTSLNTNCIDLSIDPESRCLLQTRPILSGNARATTLGMPGSIQIATLKLRATPDAVCDTTRQGKVISLEVGTLADQNGVTLRQTVKDEIREGITLDEAKVIIAGGLGVGSKEGFVLLEELAAALQGALGSSLPPVNAGTVPANYHIGQTGKIVSPELYIAVGISGQPQHLAGCDGSGTIVAINRDPQANIFKAARYGVVGDFSKIVPAFTRRCRELLSR